MAFFSYLVSLSTFPHDNLILTLNRGRPGKNCARYANALYVCLSEWPKAIVAAQMSRNFKTVGNIIYKLGDIQCDSNRL